MGEILVGVSSWADAGLVRSGFYPDEVKTPDARLRYYAAHFRLAEIDSSYHFLPTRRNLDSWLANTPPGFVFDLRAFSLFTLHPTPVASLPKTLREKYRDALAGKARIYLHHLPDAGVDELWEGFSQVAASLASVGKLGVVFFQFPPWFHPGLENRDYIASLRERLPDYPLAVEFRVAGWLSDEHREETVSLLRRSNISLVCVDEPQGLPSSLPPLALVTASPAIVRFHGRNWENWEAKNLEAGERFNYLYGEAELREWLPRIRELAREADVVHLIFKNKHADYPVRNARGMQALLGLPG